MRIRIAMILFTALVSACAGADERDAELPAEVPVNQTADVQIVQVAVQGSSYRFSPATVQADMPVRLVFDPSGLLGCSRSVTLPDYDIEKTIEEGDATIEFSPDGAGPIAVACTMNMFTGILVAE